MPLTQVQGGMIGSLPSAGSFSTLGVTGDLSFNSGYGSSATAYGCRAWVNFNGTGTVAIRGSGNVSSITDNGTSDYTINFTTAMPDINYAVAGIAGKTVGESAMMLTPQAAQTTTSVRLKAWVWNVSLDDPSYVSVSVFR